MKMVGTGYVAVVFLTIDLAAERAIALLLLKCDRSFFEYHEFFFSNTLGNFYRFDNDS
ncbi:hypothetical protein [Microcoleus vaginatus]|uniref:hypothetical protein n=1 Tax=Microcoleus vaginatus TaxID=119532 RepID=UPI001F60854B